MPELTSLLSIVELISPVHKKRKLPYCTITTSEESLELDAPAPAYSTLIVNISKEYIAPTEGVLKVKPSLESADLKVV